MIGTDHATLAVKLAKYSRPCGACLVWTGFTNGGKYGKVMVGRRACYAHRVAYEVYVGAIPASFDIDHLCGNTLCVEPTHLEAVTQLENRRRQRRHNSEKTHCKRGHELAGLNLYVHKDGRRECRACVKGRRHGWQ